MASCTHIVRQPGVFGDDRGAGFAANAQRQRQFVVGPGPAPAGGDRLGSLNGGEAVAVTIGAIGTRKTRSVVVWAGHPSRLGREIDRCIPGGPMAEVTLQA